MPTEKWTTPDSRGNVLTTELNSLSDAAFTALGSEINNATNKDRFGIAELLVTFGSAPTAESVCDLYCVPAYDGTNYGTVAQLNTYYYVGSFVLDNVTTAQIVTTGPFQLPPFKVKFQLHNKAGQAFPASGSTVSLRTFNRDVS